MLYPYFCFEGEPDGLKKMSVQHKSSVQEEVVGAWGAQRW